MDKISVVQAKAHFSEVLAQAESGDDVVITRRGTPVARLSGLTPAKKPMQLDAIDAFRAGVAPTVERGVDLIRRMRDESY